MTEPIHVIIDGIKCYAPELINESEDYPYELFSRVDSFEQRHFWYSGRKKSILNMLLRNNVIDEDLNFFEIGGGTGATSNFLKGNFKGKFLVSEISISAIKNAKLRYPHCEYVQMDARNIPFENLFNFVGMFDVIEHIEEDNLVMSNIHRALTARGFLILSVPQYQWLWSEHDQLSGHKRRYSRSSLESLLRRNGFELLDCSSFLFCAFPLMLAARLKRTKGEEVPAGNFSEVSGLEVSPILNWVLSKLTSLDSILIRAGFSLPFGGSLIAIAKRSS